MLDRTPESRLEVKGTASSGAGMGWASAPASSANLGPGFDCLAVALELRCVVSATPSTEWSVEHLDDGAAIDPADDAVLAAARVAVGEDRPVHLRVCSDIPVARGLGSSSAAHVAGALAAWRAYGEDHSSHRLFELVSSIEGHPDNAAAAVHGGLMLCTAGGGVQRLPWNPALRPLLAVPSAPLSTREARGVLPGAYRVDELVRSTARMGALIAGLLSGDPSLLADAAGDEVHESSRLGVWPHVGRLMDVARSAGAAYAAWSGAGPSVIALVSASAREHVHCALLDELGEGGLVLDPGVATTGAV